MTIEFELATCRIELAQARHDAKNHECAAKMLSAALDQTFPRRVVFDYINWAVKRETALRAELAAACAPAHHHAVPIRTLHMWRDTFLRLGDVESAQEIEQLLTGASKS